MGKIALLPDFLIDQIKAGEVLENPASAVKELVENAIDAKATEILVFIEGGGLQKIEVQDNGSGMDVEDLKLCVLRHATSKICSLEDLSKIYTKGFRGEALAAISSVSKIEIDTSTGNQAWRFVDGKVEPCARRKGTTIQVRSLFQNTPARLKFQKSPSSSAAAILKMIETISLAHPEIRFELCSNGKNVLKILPKGWKERANEVIGPLELSIKKIRGLIGRPEDGKHNRSSQYLFVNGRPVVSGLVSKAVKDGFGTRMEEKLFPAFLLFLEIPPEELDINVHPQKKEVRFLEEGKVYSMVKNAVIEAFEDRAPAFGSMPWDEYKTPLPPAFSFAEKQDPLFSQEPLSFSIEYPWRPIAQMDDFLLIEMDGWQLIDLRGALARILFEESQKKEILSEPLLMPFYLEVIDPEETSDRLAKIGIEARAISKKEIGIFSVLCGMEVADVERLILELSQEREIARALTKSLRSSKKIFSMEEAKAIWQRLQKCKDSQFDPLGKNILAKLTKEDLRRFF